MKEGDLVVRKSYEKDITFKVINIKKDSQGNDIVELKGVNIRIEADSPVEDLEVIEAGEIGKTDRIFNEKINESIRKAIRERENNFNPQYILANRKNIKNSKGKVRDSNKKGKSKKENKKEKKETKGATTVKEERELYFGRPGKILHIDGDPGYLEVCMKTYKELKLNAVGRTVKENMQPSMILDIVKEVKPDIIVITGHDGMVKGARDFVDLSNYRNSKYFVEAVAVLRNYEPNYDDLVIFAGACQSCYEAILDAGANFASSPSRVLIHCLDPVLVCEKIAYTNIQQIVCIKEVIDNTITGIKGIGGLETRGKYREGFPKSQYLK